MPPGSFFHKCGFFTCGTGGMAQEALDQASAGRSWRSRGEVNLTMEMEMVPCAGNAGVRREASRARETQTQREGKTTRRVLPRGDLSARRPVNHTGLWYFITCYYPTCMANSAENKSFCEVPKYVINTRSHCPKLMKFMDELPKQLKLMSTKITVFLNLKC